MNSVVTFSTSSRKGRVAIHEGFMYTMDRAVGITEYWKCKARPCPGRLRIIEGSVTFAGGHQHTPDTAAVIAQSGQRLMSKRSLETLETPRQIYQAAVKGMPAEAVVKLPAYRSSQRAMQRARKTNAVPLINPSTLSEIDIDAYLAHSNNIRFLLRDTGKDDQQRMLIFSTSDNFKHLANSDTWLGDGTFKITPTLFYQLYTIHGIVNGAVIPLVYALLTGKTTALYQRLF